MTAAPSTTSSTPAIAVVGLHGGVPYGAAARYAIEEADVVFGASRHLDAVSAGSAGPRAGTEAIEVAGQLSSVLDVIAARRAAGRRCCVLASGDPGFFGVTRLLAGRFGSEHLVVHPAPSAAALAAARLGASWDDAVVVSAHGRPLAKAVAEIVSAGPKVMVLTSPATPPEAVGAALLDAGAAFTEAAVCSDLGSDREAIVHTDLGGLASGLFSGVSVVVLECRGPAGGRGASGRGGERGEERDGERGGGEPVLRFGRPAPVFDHRAGMVTKPEVRIAAIARLDLPRGGVLWDLGAGSGSVAVECALLAPALRVVAVERRDEDAARIRRNAAALGAHVEVVVGAAPDVLGALDDPDRIFVGGGGLAVLDAALARLRPQGRLVATFAAPERAAEAFHRLGNMVQISVDRAVALPDGATRMEAENPVFLAWGPGAES